MTGTPRFQMLGEPEAMVCEDGVCAVPGAADPHEVEPDPPR